MAVFKMIIAFLTITCLLAGVLNHKSVAVIGGTLIPRIKSVIDVKATKPGCVLDLAVTPLLKIWHTLHCRQTVSRPASFEWFGILLPTSHLSPQLAPTILSSPSYLHGDSCQLWGATGQLTFVASRT